RLRQKARAQAAPVTAVDYQRHELHEDDGIGAGQHEGAEADVLALVEVLQLYLAGHHEALEVALYRIHAGITGFRLGGGTATDRHVTVVIHRHYISATTAKPRPCSPARAASIAAFRASTRYLDESRAMRRVCCCRPSSISRSCSLKAAKAVSRVSSAAAGDRSSCTESIWVKPARPRGSSWLGWWCRSTSAPAPRASATRRSPSSACQASRALRAMMTSASSRRCWPQ